MQDEHEADVNECFVTNCVARCCKYEFGTVACSSSIMSLEGVGLLKCNYVHVLDSVALGDLTLPQFLL